VSPDLDLWDRLFESVSRRASLSVSFVACVFVRACEALYSGALLTAEIIYGRREAKVRVVRVWSINGMMQKGEK
jgi:hypothetical protein